MVTHNSQGVKGFWTRFRAWIDQHPRTGWYVSAVVTLNLLLQLVDLVK